MKINILPVIIIIFSISAIIYTVHLTINYPIYYINKYYIAIVSLLIVLSFYLLIIFKFDPRTKKNINTLIISTIITLYLCEIVVYLHFGSEGIWQKSDPRTKFEVIQDYRKESIDTYTNIFPASFIINDGIRTENGDLFPLGGISNKTIISSNENDFWCTYQSDEHGFNNDKGLYTSHNIDIAIVGDSFAEGYCVHNEDQIHSLLKSFGFEVINFGKNGSGPLVEYAIFKEYVVNLNPKIVLWLYCEENDFVNLITEKRSKFLMNYFLNDDFSQYLINKQDFIDQTLIKYNDEHELTYLGDSASKLKRGGQGYFQKTLSIIKFENIWRKIIPLRFMHGNYNLQKVQTEQINTFKQILFKTNSYIDSWDGQLLFVYIPSMTKLKSFHKFNTIQTNINKNYIIEVLNELDIKFVDIENFLYDHKYGNILALSEQHFNKKGYLLVSNIIHEELKKIFVK